MCVAFGKELLFDRGATGGLASLVSPQLETNPSPNLKPPTLIPFPQKSNQTGGVRHGSRAQGHACGWREGYRLRGARGGEEIHREASRSAHDAEDPDDRR